jgi:hypothetical protein
LERRPGISTSTDAPLPGTHPVQMKLNYGGGRHLTTAVTLRTYEVYCHLYRPQPAMVTGDCRGGFSAGEIVAFLYARSFPQTEGRSASTKP